MVPNLKMVENLEMVPNLKNAFEIKIGSFPEMVPKKMVLFSKPGSNKKVPTTNGFKRY